MRTRALPLSATGQRAEIENDSDPDWGRASKELVRHLRSLIRFRSVNPPGNEIAAAAYVARVLRAAGVDAAILEPAPRRGSVVARVRGDGSAGGPLLLLSHLDVVPVKEEHWMQPPFGGEIEAGYVYGRGAVDAKSLVAMEVQVLVELARRARSKGLNPACDPCL